MNTEKNNSKTIPSLLVNELITFLSNILSDNNTANSVVINIVIGNSFFTVLFFTFNGWNKDDTPSINNILRILLPITFPSTISPLFDNRDLTLTANSGSLVPNATIVNPISILDTLKFSAILLAPSTKISAPFISTIKPTINKSIIWIKNNSNKN